MTEAEVTDRLRELFGEVFGRDDLALTAATTAQDVPGWDSFKQIEIAVAVEERFGIKLRTRDMARLKDFGELCGLVSARLDQRAAS